MSQLDPRSQRVRRRRNREHTRNSRLRKRQQETNDLDPIVNNNINVEDVEQSRSIQDDAEEQIIEKAVAKPSKKRVKCYKCNRKYKSENQLRQKKVHMLQKRLVRQNNKIQSQKDASDPTSPEAVVNSFLQKNKCNTSADIKKKFVSASIF